MIRLIDHIRNDIKSNAYAKIDAVTTEFPIVVGDSVAEYFYLSSGKETWSLIKDFPILSPPFKNYWMEFHSPARYIRNGDPVIWNPQLPNLWGWSISSVDILEDKDRSRQILEKSLIAFGQDTSFSDPFAEVKVNFYRKMVESIKRDSVEDKEVRWMCLFDLYMYVEKKLAIGPVAKFTVFVNKDGSVSSMTGIEGDEKDAAITAHLNVKDYVYGHTYSKKKGYSTPERGTADYNNALLDMYNSYLCPALLTISMMHCKNVSLVEQRPSSKLSKRRSERTGAPPLMRFKTLEIEPMKRILRTVGDQEQKGIKQALHICRGHFKDYRQGGLFGRHKGIFWWDSIIRGNEKIGKIEKKYEVKGTL